jgi:hypothetical protein
VKRVHNPAQHTFFSSIGKPIATLDGLFTARPLLRVTEARRIYALVALAHPRVTPRQWDAFVRRHMRIAPERGGLVALEDQRHYVHAVFRYAVDASPLIGHGRTLRLRDLVVAQLPGRPLVLALAACAECLAASLGCTAVALDVPAAAVAFAEAAAPGQAGSGRGTHAATATALQARGFGLASATMLRTFATV